MASAGAWIMIVLETCVMLPPQAKVAVVSEWLNDDD
jgi:hypothetical protein